MSYGKNFHTTKIDFFLTASVSKTGSIFKGKITNFFSSYVKWHIIWNINVHDFPLNKPMCRKFDSTFYSRTCNFVFPWKVRLKIVIY